MGKIKNGEDNNCPPSVALWFLKCVFTCLCHRAAQRASLAWCQTPSLLTRPNNHPAICTCSNYYPISKKYRTITARNPHTQATAGCKNPGREKLAGSSNSSDQTAINQQRHISLWRTYRQKLNTFSSNREGSRRGRWEDTDVAQRRGDLYLLLVSVAQMDKISPCQIP